jgi:hypothetical protein
MSYLDDELIADLKRLNINFSILSEAEHAAIVRQINERILFAGSQIAWSALENSINFGSASSNLAIYMLAKKISAMADGEFIFIGDSACDDAYSVKFEHLEQALRVFSELPQHTYILQKSVAWIACISFEGHLDFANISCG